MTRTASGWLVSIRPSMVASEPRRLIPVSPSRARRAASRSILGVSVLPLRGGHFLPRRREPSDVLDVQLLIVRADQEATAVKNWKCLCAWHELPQTPSVRGDAHPVEPRFHSGSLAITLRNGIASDDLSLSTQLVGTHLTEDVLARASHAFQSVTDWQIQRLSIG